MRYRLLSAMLFGNLRHPPIRHKADVVVGAHAMEGSTPLGLGEYSGRILIGVAESITITRGLVRANPPT